MLYSVEDASVKLGVSKMTIYNKVKLKEFKDKVIKKAGKTYIDEDLLNLIKDSLKDSVKLKTEVESEDIENTTSDEVATDTEGFVNFDKDYIQSLQDTIEFLKEQLTTKDKHIDDLVGQLGTSQDLTKNMQVLLKQEQDMKGQDKILMLEEHFRELDNKLIDIRERMQEQKDKNKGFIKRLFSKE